MTCEATKNCDTAAKCDRCSAGGTSEDASGLDSGSLMWPRIVESLLPPGSAPTPPISGPAATAERRTTGADRCTDCMVGQGDDCHCWRPADPITLRWVAVGLAVFWLLVGLGVRSCTA